ncbi:hypothetical protein AGMMS4952_02960 [Spirochaetia bacterium]|nr:hypothetical protein AGMMS4952_02960 [Spirochaetia bacterium]
MPEKIEIDLYHFIRSELSGLRSELGGLESRIEKRFSDFEVRTDKRFDQMSEQFKELKEEVRWPRRIAIAGVITTVLAVGFAIIGFKS